MRIEQLEYLTAVTRLGSLRRAADELHISQPALSETVRNLERELGVDLLDRRRSGATVSAEGSELLPHIATVLDAVDELRRAARDQHVTRRMVRLGTVHSATVPLLVPTVQDFRAAHPDTQVEVVGAQQADIHRALLEGALDLGLVNYLRGDDIPPGFDSTELLRGHPVVCVHPGSRLAALDRVTLDDLLAEPLIVMRSGYVMHRYVYRLLGGRTPSFSYSTDGAEMGKLMVAEGLGATVLPDFSVIGDPLERLGAITCRPLVEPSAVAARGGAADGRATEVMLVAQRRQSATGTASPAARDLLARFVARARAHREAASGEPG